MSTETVRTETAGDPVLVEVDGPFATITLNRPESRNAVNDEMRSRLTGALAEVARQDSVRVVVLTGAGRAFCAGGDVRSMRERAAAPAGEVAFRGWTRQKGTAEFVQRLHNADQITIAAVNGPAVGLGLDIALACDFVVASPEARFASSFVKRGLIPDGGGLSFLPRRVGLSVTKQLIYSGRMVEFEEACAIGLVDRAASAEGLLDEARAFAEQFAENSRPAIALMKSIVNRSFELSLGEVAALGGQAQAISYTTGEHRAAVEAFLNR